MTTPKSIANSLLILAWMLFPFAFLEAQADTVQLAIDFDWSRRDGENTYWEAADRIAFEDLDGDGEQELITLEDKRKHERTTYVTISSWDGRERQIEWQSDGVFTPRFFLVGNVTNDHASELVIVDANPDNNGGDSIQVLGWNGETYSTIATSGAFIPDVANLLDIDGDGVQELALVYQQPGAVWRDAIGVPTTLSLLKVEGSDLIELDSIAVEHEIWGLAVEDLNGDGLVELVTYEISYELRVEGQVSVHTVVPDHGIVRHHSFNWFVPTGSMSVTFDRHSFFDTFRCNDISYFYMDKGTIDWKSVFQFKEKQNGEWSFEPVGPRESHIHNAAILSTMVYNQDHSTYVRYSNADRKYLFIPSSELQPVHPVKSCE